MNTNEKLKKSFEKRVKKDFKRGFPPLSYFYLN